MRTKTQPFFLMHRLIPKGHLYDQSLSLIYLKYQNK